MEHVLMNTTLAQSSLLPFKFDFVLCGIGVVVLLVLGILVFNFGTIHIRALFSGAKVTITELIALRRPPTQGNYQTLASICVWGEHPIAPTRIFGIIRKR